MVRSLSERPRFALTMEPAEFRMRFQGVLERAAVDTAVQRDPVPGPYLTVSREVASGGSELARRVGQILGWSVLDRELVHSLAKRLELEPRLLELMDETRVNWFSETLLNLFNSRLVLQDSFVSMLSRGMALAAFEGRVVFVGRAGNLVLPPEGGLRVRIVAPRGLRVAALAEREELDVRAAERRLSDLDDSRTEFVRRHFHVDSSDPGNYDLVMDIARLGIGGAADLICRALELRGLTGSSESPVGLTG